MFKNAVIRVTRTDTQLLAECVDINLYAFSYRATKWAEEAATKKVLVPSLPDPFVKEHLSQKPKLAEYLNQAYKLMYPKMPLRTLSQPKVFGDWRDECVRWWNHRVHNTNSEMTKQGQLYLSGPSNTGKTEFINKYLLSGINVRNIFKIRFEKSNNFMWQSFDPDVHAVVLFDEFNMNEVIIFFKSLMILII